MTEVVITGAARTPVGAFLGGLSSLSASALGEIAIKEALSRAGVSPEDVSEVIMGQILAAGGGQNPARQAAMAAGIPQEKTAYGINQLCGSGLRTVALGYQAIKMGDSDIVVAGGHESMSQAPHVMHLRNGVKMGSGELLDTLPRGAVITAPLAGGPSTTPLLNAEASLRRCGLLGTERASHASIIASKGQSDG